MKSGAKEYLPVINNDVIVVLLHNNVLKTKNVLLCSLLDMLKITLKMFGPTL